MISFYTTCFGRLDHLQETLPRNLEAASGCEFVVVDWDNSPELLAMLEALRPVDVKLVTVASEEWELNAARNYGWRNCRHDIRVSLDADNWIADPLVIDWLKAEFDPSNGGDTHYIYGTGNRGNHGRIAATEAAYKTVGGWPEGIAPGAADVAEMVGKWQQRHYTSRRWPRDSFGVIDHEVKYGP